MQTSHGFSAFSDEEIRQIAQALHESDATSSSTISESELRDIIHALQETGETGRTAEQGETAENRVVSKGVPEESGYGKSNFVFRGLDDDDEVEGAAGTGAVGTAYPHTRSLVQVRMQTGYGFSTLSDEETWETEQAHRGTDATSESVVSETELKEILNALQETSLCDIAGKTTREDKNTEKSVVNIAVLGESGSGKSTFVNVIRGLDGDEVEGAAKTGVVETTKYPTAYPHPRYKNVLFWDHPGSGTLGFNPVSYLKTVNVHQYHLFIIVASARVRENDMELAKELWSTGKKLFLVRNKIDSDMRASKLRRNKEFNEEQILEDVRVNCIKNLMDCGIRLPRVFLVSCLELEKYDFALLERTLEMEVKP